MAGNLPPETKLKVAFDRISQPGNTLIAWEGSDPWEQTPAKRIEFSHRLDGGEWSPFKAETQVMLLGLATGKHTFEVRARDLDFNLEPTPAHFQFVVVAPIWRQPWFICLMTGLVGAVTTQTIRVLLRDSRLSAINQTLAVEIEEHKRAEVQLEEKTEKLEDEVEERKAIEAALVEQRNALEKEIEQRRRMEREVERVHQQLLDTSREAGMAEVATSVLHNVGNVLNSINVSTYVLMDKFKSSKADFVSRIGDLMGEHVGNLGEFIMRDPKGQQLPSYIARLGEQLKAEQTLALEELSLLQKNVEHIKEIVAMQQSYGRVFAVTTKVRIIELVEDALRIHESALARHGVNVVREYCAARKEILVDRHKVLQILVNLISNSKNACDEVQRRDKQVTIRVTDDEKRIRISVIDNGVGILQENLTRVFNHGFTTRKNGHGFGLHSGALTAKELGGALLLHSDGPGTGATFTLEIPLQSPGCVVEPNGQVPSIP